MPRLQKETRELFEYLNQNRAVRDKIKALPGNSPIFYAGDWNEPAWREIERLKTEGDSRFDNKETLHDALKRIVVAGPPPRTLLRWILDVENSVPRKPDRFIVWRALSGIYAANASPPISFAVGGNVTGDKVFIATELPVLLRNSKVLADPDLRDVLEFCDKCFREKRTEILVPYLAE